MWSDSNSRRTKRSGKLLTFITNSRDMESGGTFSNIQDVISKINKSGEEIRMEIDDVSY